MDGRYVTLSTDQNIIGGKKFMGIVVSANSAYQRWMKYDTSNYETGLIWVNTTGASRLAEFGYHNTNKRLFIIPQYVSSGYDDKVGNYALRIGVNELTYNTYNIWHAGNSNSQSFDWNVRNLIVKGTTTMYGNAYFGGANYYITSSGDATVRMIICKGTGNDYSSSGIQVLGNGTADSIYPNVGFHQPGLYASSLQLRALNEFYFRAQGDGANANVNANLFRSTVATGTQPYACSSTTLNTNLNADLLDGLHATDFPRVYTARYTVNNGSKWVRVGYFNYPSADTPPSFMITLSNNYAHTRNVSVTFIVSQSHGNNTPIITQLNGDPFWVSAVRVLSLTSGGYGMKYLDAYCNMPTGTGYNDLQVRVINLVANTSYYFIPYTVYTSGTSIPSGYTIIGSFNFGLGLGSNKDITIDGTGNFTNVYATGAITAMQTSDYALKHNFDGTIDYRSKLLRLGRVYDYDYNDKALRLYEGTLDKKRHTGLIYQNAKIAGITGFCHDLDKNGYGALNYLSPDLMATVIGAVQANILSIRMVETEQDRIRKELAKAKAEIEELRRELAHRGS